jgi:hypothetical protein
MVNSSIRPGVGYLFISIVNASFILVSKLAQPEEYAGYLVELSTSGGIRKHRVIRYWI